MSKIKRIIRQYPTLMSICKFLNTNFKKTIVIPKNYILVHTFMKRFTNNISSNQRKVFYFCIPLHPNLGDQAQKLCIEMWLKENFSDHCIYKIPSLIGLKSKSIYNLINNNINSKDFIIIQSGYCTTDLHGIDELVHRKICLTIKDIPILMLPQTINFISDKEKLKSSTIYKNSKNLIFLARDKISFSNLKQMTDGHNEIHLYPDIVTNLIGKNLKFNYKRKNILFCIRNDGESFYKHKDIMQTIKNIESEYHTHVDFIDTTIHSQKSYNYKKEIYNFFDIFAHYDLVITDRYHGTIFALIAATPVIVLKTTDHKVYSGVDWFEYIYPDFIQRADNLECILDLIPKIKKNTANIILNPILKNQYYDKLAIEINKILED